MVDGAGSAQGVAWSVPRLFRLPAAAVAAVVALVWAGLPAGAQDPGAAAPAAPLSQAQAEADAANARLDELIRSLDAGAEELSRLGEQLRTLELDTTAAQAAQESARRRGEEAAVRLADAEARLAEVEQVLAERSAARAARAVELYKRGVGTGDGADLLGSLAADRSDTFTQGLSYLEALFVADAARQEDVEAVVAVADGTRARIAELRDEARAQEELAAQAAAVAAGLRVELAQVTAATQVAQSRRGELLATLERDLAARQALIARLEAQSATLGDVAGQELSDDWIARLPPAGQEWAEAMKTAAASGPIDPRLLAAVAWTESNFRPNAVSPVGAFGLVQLMPGTAAGLGVDPRVPEQNLLGGSRYLRQLLDRYPGHPEHAIAAYNAGPGRVDSAGGIPNIPETQAYVTRVLGRYSELAG